MSDKKKSFIVYNDIAEQVNTLPDDERGRLFSAMLSYAADGIEPDSLGEAGTMAFRWIRAQMDRDRAKYEDICERRSQYAKEGISKHKQAKANKSKNKQANNTDTDNVNVNDSDSENENENGNDNEINIQPPNPLRGNDERFETFWSAYPRKTGKEAARKAWKKAKVNNELFNRIMKSIEIAKQCDQWNKDGGQYIPNPATWINQGRWDDEYRMTESGDDVLTAIIEGRA